MRSNLYAFKTFSKSPLYKISIQLSIFNKMEFFVKFDIQNWK